MLLDALPRLAASTRVVLASASPRRAELLRQLGITKFDVRPSSFAEDLPKTTDGASYARATAKAKAKEVAALVAKEARAASEPRNVLVIAADTVVEVDSLILEKPSETDGGLDGREMLRRLSGREHKVSTGVALVLVRKGGTEGGDEVEGATSSKSFSETTVVRFADLPGSEIDAYVASGENLGKAGGYGIQVRGLVVLREREKRGWGGREERSLEKKKETHLFFFSFILDLQKSRAPREPSWKGSKGAISMSSGCRCMRWRGRWRR